MNIQSELEKIHHRFGTTEKANYEIQKLFDIAVKANIQEFVEIINDLPNNRPLYRDSGLWQIRTEDMEDVIFWQECNESFEEFIKRVHLKENEINKSQRAI